MAFPSVSPTRVAFYDSIVDECLRDAALMRDGFMHWAEEVVPHWEAIGLREAPRRERIEAARAVSLLCQQLEAADATPGQIRKQLRTLFEGIRAEGLDFYELMLKHTGQREPPHRGTTDDLVQRQALRIMVAQAEIAAERAYCMWAERTDAPDTQALRGNRDRIYDLSGVEELQLHLGLLRYQQTCFAHRPRLSREALETAFFTWGHAAREDFHRTHGFLPEEATTPFTPMTIAGPVDHDEYYAALRAEEDEQS